MNKRNIFTSLFVFGCGILFAQKDSLVSTIKIKELADPKTLSWKENLQLGNRLYEVGSLYNGVRYYQEALNKNPAKTELYQPLAEGYFALRDYANAAKNYKLLTDADGGNNNPYAIYSYALAEKYSGNYESARRIFEKFNNVAKNIDQLADVRKSAVLEIKGCDLALQLLSNKKRNEYTVDVLDSNINQQFTDYAPYLADDNTLYYGTWVSDSLVLKGKTEKYATYSRIYSSKLTPNGWKKAEPVMGKLNEVGFHTGNAQFSADGKIMYYTQCYQVESQAMVCNIYKSKWQSDGWSEGEKVSFNANGVNTDHPAPGKDEKGNDVIYFSADRTKGRGMDLFYVKVNGDGTFGNPVVVTAANTKGDEVTPFFDVKTNTLYFSSNGRVNIGGFDIYRTRIENGTWTEPEHMGIPVNSSVDDMYYTWSNNASMGFLVSNRVGGFGLKSPTCCDDIYSVHYNRLYPAVKGVLVGDNGEPITNQQITLYDAVTEKPVQTVTVTDGKFFFPLLPEKQYKLGGTRDDYFAAYQTFNTVGITKSDTQTVELRFKKMEKNKAYTLNNIYYEYDKAALSASSKAVLDTLFEMLKENPAIVIEISSHTDSKGADKYNLDLSQKRAESCVNYLIKEKGVDKARLTAKGYGKTLPVVPNTNPDGSDNEEGRAKNRRTEFKIVGEIK